MQADNRITSPLDARLMNALASVLLVVAGCACAGLAGWWLTRLPQFHITHLHVDGDTAHTSAYVLRREILPQLRGNFFSVRLDEVRALFESMPWVRRAVVRRVFPNQLHIQIEEQKEAALWGNESEGWRMLNEQGEIFDPNIDEAARQDLPELSGTDAAAPQVLDMYRALNPLFTPLQTGIERLSLTAGGGWAVTLQNGAVLQLGNGTQPEMQRRTHQFVASITPVVARYGRALGDLRSADLRYRSGYAIQLRGLGTVDTGTPAGQKD